jgi:hypothetical protein
VTDATHQDVEAVRREIPPKDNVYVDQFWSGMYGTLCSFAQSEARLIWMRYSAFLVFHSLLFNFIRDVLGRELINSK